MLKINLGGTCGNSKWRNELIEKLNKKIEYRNPVVKNGTWKYNKTIKLKKENDMRECDYLVYVITPRQKGFSSIASAVDYSNKVPKKVIFCILKEYENEKNCMQSYDFSIMFYDCYFWCISSKYISNC